LTLILTGNGQDKRPHLFLSGWFTENTAEARADLYHNLPVNPDCQPVLRG